MSEFNLEELSELNKYIWLTRVLISCVDLNLFPILGENGARVEELTQKTHTSERGLKALLDVLIPLGLLTCDDKGVFTPTENGKAMMFPDSPVSMVPRIKHLERLWRAWGDLTETIKKGTPYWLRHSEKRDISDLVNLAEGLFANNHKLALEMAELMGIGSKWAGLTILDVGAGSGAWSIACLEKDKTSNAVAVDFGPVLEMAKRKAKEAGVEERFQFKPGNIREIDFGESVYDLIILGNICHSEGVKHSKSLIKKCARALKPSGKLVIADMIPDDDRRGPLFPLLFALNMLVNTEEGGTYTFAEYKLWCEEAGLEKASLLPLPIQHHSPLIIAEKPADV